MQLTDSNISQANEKHLRELLVYLHSKTGETSEIENFISEIIQSRFHCKSREVLQDIQNRQTSMDTITACVRKKAWNLLEHIESHFDKFRNIPFKTWDNLDWSERVKLGNNKHGVSLLTYG